MLSGDDRERLIQLSIFPKYIAIPLSAAAAVWASNEMDSEDTAWRLARLSLLKLDLQRGTIRLHDVMRSWLAANTVNAASLHSRLVWSWADWMHLPDQYAWRWLTWHLAQADRKADLESVLWNPQWLQAKLDATDVNSLMADFEHVAPSNEAQLMRRALRLSAHVLARDKERTLEPVGRAHWT